ncbi:hydrolase [Streptomyces phage Tomas]|uniref:Hydrolase n=1 Tax=Streptomyces phage Tomas TaxID=2914443 RepID=A0AA49H3N5_9CAUD|nr:transglycosylase [Streptomyces phage Tomas]UMO76232.1 hydrolase [Streptomyces phage Tomas]
MGQDMRGNIAAGALILGVATAVFVTAAAETGNSAFNTPETSSSQSPSAQPSKSEAPKVVVNSAKPSLTSSPSLKVTTLRIENVAYSKSIKSTKSYAKSKLKKKYPKSYKTQYSCLVNLWKKESGWNYKAKNPHSGAYGIPQSLPGSKMKSAGKDWKTNPRTQVNWGLDKYIYKRYGTPCTAWSHFKKKGWY